MRTLSRIRGFTLIEVLVVSAIIAVLVSISATTFRSMYVHENIRGGANEVYSALLSAREKTRASEGGQVHGVHVSSTTVTRFEGDTYVPGGASNLVYAFKESVRATSSLMTTGGVSITFSRLVGTSSVEGTLYVYDTLGSGTTTLILYGSGLVEYE